VEAVVVVAQEFFRLELMLLEVLTQADQAVAREERLLQVADLAVMAETLYTVLTLVLLP
jgi:hypothetical protein